MQELRTLFARAGLDEWDMADADCLQRARFLLQHNPCDVLLIDESLCPAADPAALAWLAPLGNVPAIFLAAMEPDTIARAYEAGASICLPRQATLDNPPMLAAALRRAASIGDMSNNLRRSADRLHQCRRQIDRLVHLVWRNVPMDPDQQLLTHRHVLERMQEEVARCGRHGQTFTVAVGEVQAEHAGTDSPDELADWTTSEVARAKRRCDVAGHYGLRGFMLLMVHTPRPGGVSCCRRLQALLEEKARKHSGPRGPVRASFGLSSFGPDCATSELLLSKAELHLEAAKAGAAGGVVAE
jgi:diguanylate cyclase (GGDEF)-like protein